MSSIDFDIECAGCGVSLRGQSLDGRCPVCSRPITQLLNVTVIDHDNMTVERDLPCLGCGYNLRSLQLRGVCPECGCPVTRSLPPPPLRSADRGWLYRVASGAGLVLLSAFFLYAPWAKNPTPASHVFHFGMVIALTAGVFLITAPDPLSRRRIALPHPNRFRLNATRHFARIGVLTWAGIASASLFQAITGIRTWTILVSGSRVVIAFVLQVLAFAAAYVGTGVRVRGLAARADDSRLRRLAGWWMGITITLTVLELCWETPVPIRHWLYVWMGSPASGIVFDVLGHCVQILQFAFWLFGVATLGLTMWTLIGAITDRPPRRLLPPVVGQ